jgi:dTDP-4-dehydrorhamnose 3,5-epimerase
MAVTTLKIQGSYELTLEPIRDERGFFSRAFSAKEFSQLTGQEFQLTQSDISFSKHKGTLRGMHFQLNPHGQAKIVRCVRGALFDAFVDLRPQSPTYGKWEARELSSENRVALYIPEGCAHGFITLTDDVEIHYLCSKDYHPASYRSLRWDDPHVGILWPIQPTVISPKDADAPTLAQLAHEL